MNKKWCFGTLLTVLALLVVVQQETVVPNQEIVLEFVDIEVTSPEAQNAITIVKKRLQSLGAKKTRVSQELRNGTLKITYYSDTDVESIKKTLSEEQGIALDHIVYDQNGDDNQYPFNDDFKDYNLDVYEIHKSTDLDTGFNEKYLLKVTYKREGNTNYTLYSFVTDIDDTRINRLVKVAQKLYADIALAIDNTSRTIPEVRAGPIS